MSKESGKPAAIANRRQNVAANTDNMTPARVAADTASHATRFNRSSTLYSTQLPAHASRAGIGQRKKDEAEFTRGL
jgi:hypothetical protein